MHCLGSSTSKYHRNNPKHFVFNPILPISRKRLVYFIINSRVINWVAGFCFIKFCFVVFIVMKIGILFNKINPFSIKLSCYTSFVRAYSFSTNINCYSINILIFLSQFKIKKQFLSFFLPVVSPIYNCSCPITI
jgi:hypothetical protein